METAGKETRELGAPPLYNSRGYEPLREEIEFQNSSVQHVQSTVVTVIPDGPPVRDHIIWSFFNAVYLNFCCLGVLAFVFSVKARDRNLLGDKNGANSYGSTARSLNIAATVLSILTIVIVIIVAIVQVVKVTEMQSEQFNQFNQFGNGYGK
ncbi:interferon-induced transmembrane protein 3-like [Gastrophryne carolinensis]